MQITRAMRQVCSIYNTVLLVNTINHCNIADDKDVVYVVNCWLEDLREVILQCAAKK